MSSLKFNNLKKQSNIIKPEFTYTDLHLDLAYDFNKRDIVVDYDEQAIKNSLINIFSTIPGERFLIPKFGCNLLDFIFTSVSTATMTMIQQRILDAVKIWEPRVKIKEPVTIVGNPDTHEYIISLIVYIPRLKITTNLGGILTKEGFRSLG